MVSNNALDYGGRTVNKVFHQDFIIDKRFQVVKELGHGAYGIVCSAEYTDGSPNGEKSYVAIKKITNIFTKKILCKRSLRELKLLQFFRGHKNITCLYDLDIVPDPFTGDFNDVYLYEELMECDMHQIIRSGQLLSDLHYQYFIYQTLCGLKYIHSADVLHRDLKPGNLLVNADCELKICDFGLARGFSEDPEQNAGFMTEYVATRWYRAPEIMLSFTNYTKAIDVWSVGCILAELLGGKPLFRGKDYVDQLNQILLILGTPTEETLTKIGSIRAQNYVRSLPIMKKVPYTKLFPDANPLALDLLDKMLTLDPYKRISVEDALNHPYLSVWHDPQDEPECQVKFDFKSFEKVDDMHSLKKIIVDEVKNFREFVRKPLQEQQQIQLQLQLQQQQQVQEQNSQVKDNQNSDADYLGPMSHQQFNELLSSNNTHSGNFNSTGAEVNTNPAFGNEKEIQFYSTMPKPQEVSEFMMSNNMNETDAHSMNENDNVNDIFRLEEELGFGLDGMGTFHNI